LRQELAEKKHLENADRQTDRQTRRLTIRVAKAESSRANNNLNDA